MLAYLEKIILVQLRLKCSKLFYKILRIDIRYPIIYKKKEYRLFANFLSVIRTLFTLNLLNFDYSLVFLQIIVCES